VLKHSLLPTDEIVEEECAVIITHDTRFSNAQFGANRRVRNAQQMREDLGDSNTVMALMKGVAFHTFVYYSLLAFLLTGIYIA
jgi:hypothetical protein